MKIAILGAMAEEIKPLLKFFNSYKIIEYASNKYYTTNYKGIEIVVAYSKIGKVFSTLSASTMIEKFNCDILLFSGVAGGINPNLKIGDLIVATKLAQHDLDITAFGHPYGYVPEGKVYIDTDIKLIEIAKKVAIQNNIKLLDGIIATGDQFIADDAKKQWIADEFKADALEMEGASVGVVCDSLNIPFFVIRSISDTADMDAGFNFDKFLEESANVSADFLIKMLDIIIQK